MLIVTTLGTPGIHDATGQEVRLRSRKQLGVLLVLALDGRDQPVPRAMLEEFFWHDAPGAKAYHSLCQAITAIRAALGRSAIQRTHDAFRLGVDVRTDLEALGDDDLGIPGLSRPLDGMEWWGGPAFGHWLEGARVRFRRMAEQVLLDAIARFRLGGATLRVHRAAERLYELDPLSEPAALALAERELLRGDVVGAIRLLRLHLARLEETLGCRPQPAIERLLRRLEVGAHPPVELVPPRLAAHAARVRPTVLVAREHELGFLEGEWQRVARDGTLRTCMVTGPGGIGKSSLARRFAATVAARAHSVLLISCQEIGEGIPFAATSDLAAALLRDPAISSTDPAWLAEVSRIHPVIRSKYTGVPEPLATPPETVRLRVGDGLTHMLEAVTDGAPVTIIFDDIQYMDPASRDVLHVLARRAQSLPLLLMGAARSRGMEPTLPRGPLDDEPLAWTSTLRLAPLSAEGMRTLIATLAPSLQLDAPRVVDRIIGLADGNPQFAEMLLADWDRHASQSLAAGLAVEQLPRHWEPPDSLRQAFARLYDGLDAVARQVLHVLAVAQRALSPEEVAQAVSRTPADLDAAALELLSRGILRLEGGGLCFKNELHRAYPYFAMDDETRKYYHAILARALTVHADERDYRSRLEAASHLLGCERLDEATTLLHAATKDAVDAGAYQEMERALLDLCDAQGDNPSPRILIALSSTQATGGRPRDALKSLARVSRPECTPREALEVDVLTVRAETVLRRHSSEVLRAAGERILQQALETGELDLATHALQVVAQASAEAGLAERLTALLPMCRSLVRAPNDEQAAQAALALGFIHLSGGEYAEAREAFDSGLARLGGGHSPLLLRSRLLNGLGMALTGVGAYDDALRTYQRLQSTAKKSPLIPAPHLWLNMAVIHQERGRLCSAAQCFERSLRAVAEHPDPRIRTEVYSNCASFAIETGDVESADRYLRLAESIAEASRILNELVNTILVRADFHLAVEEDELAWRLVRDRIPSYETRKHFIGEVTRHARLDLHYRLASRSRQVPLEWLQQTQHLDERLPVHGRIEMACFTAWAREKYLGMLGGDVLENAALEGFGGVVLRLGAVKTLPTLTKSADCLATAQMLVESYPTLFPEGLPTPLDWNPPAT